MVFFTCNACGTSVKKNQVENHTYQCRNCQSLSCMDCNKEFWGNEYKQHIKCISEDQKYGGKDFKPKESSNKGEIKQAKWIEHINATLASKQISGPLSGLLEQITQYTNIPRKKAKFENFLSNSLKIRSPKLISDAWEIFDQGKKNESEEANSKAPKVNGTPTTNGTNSITDNDSSNSSGKRPSDSQNNPPAKRKNLGSSQNNKENHTEFDWCATSEELLQNYPSGIKEKTLRKQLVRNMQNSSFGPEAEEKTESLAKHLIKGAMGLKLGIKVLLKLQLASNEKVKEIFSRITQIETRLRHLDEVVDNLTAHLSKTETCAHGENSKEGILKRLRKENKRLQKKVIELEGEVDEIVLS